MTDDEEIVRKCCSKAIYIEDMTYDEVCILAAAVGVFERSQETYVKTIDEIIKSHATPFERESGMVDLCLDDHYIHKRGDNVSWRGITLDEAVTLRGMKSLLAISVKNIDDIKKSICQTHKLKYSPTLTVPKGEFPQSDWDALESEKYGGKILYSTRPRVYPRVYRPLDNAKAEIVMGKFVVFSAHGSF